MLDMQTMKLSDLKPAPYNPRVDLKPGDKEFEKLKRSVETFGLVEPVVFNKRSGYVVGGHQRLKVLQIMGFDEVPVSVVDLDDDMERALNVALNKIEGDWDYAKLKDLLQELDTGAFDLDLTGFDSDEIENLMTAVFTEDEDIKEDNYDPDEVLEKEETITQLGDVWQLGDHRLMCGDSTKEDDVLQLVGSVEVDMVFTDPPYNVDYTGKTKAALKIENDKMADNDFYNFLLDSFIAMFKVCREGAPIYVCHADSEGKNFRTAFEDAGWLMKQCLIWVKNVMVMGRQDYHWKHEPILYGWKPGAAHKWYGGRKQTTVHETSANVGIEHFDDHSKFTFSDGNRSVVFKVKDYEIVFDGEDEQSSIWFLDRPSRNAEHPTMKPINLCARAIMNSSKPGDYILDPFGGSGSTLMAAEQAGRKCLIMEFEPKYCDVVIHRWESFTGKKAIRLK